MNHHKTQRVRFGRDFSIMARRWRQFVQSQLALSGMTDTSWVPLIHLSELPDGITLKALAIRVGVESSSLVRIIDMLERDNLVHRQRDQLDGRAKLILLTTAGHERVAEIRQALSQVESAILTDISDDELAVMFGVFDKIEERLSELGPGAKQEPAT